MSPIKSGLMSPIMSGYLAAPRALSDSLSWWSSSAWAACCDSSGYVGLEGTMVGDFFGRLIVYYD